MKIKFCIEITLDINNKFSLIKFNDNKELIKNQEQISL
jgi:hypothetical protein